MHPDLANFFEYRFIVESFPVMTIEIFAGDYDDEQSIKLARPGSILRTQRAAARDPGVSLELPVSLLAVFPGDRQRGWANRPERRALPDSRVGAQRVGTTTPGFRRHRFADIRETRNRFASSRSLAPASIISAAASRTCSRRARSAASRPPPSGYLMHPA